MMQPGEKLLDTTSYTMHVCDCADHIKHRGDLRTGLQCGILLLNCKAIN